MALPRFSDTSTGINAVYIWIGERGFSGGLQSEARTLPAGPVSGPSNLPRWDHPSGLTLHPRAVFNGPFKGVDILVICDAYSPNGEPFHTNKRYDAAIIYCHHDVATQYPWIVIQQEYALVPFDGQSPASQGQYYPDAGAVNDIVREHYSACLSAGIDISGTNGRIPDNCKFQVGKWGFADGIFVADQLCAAHFILKVIAERHRMLVSFEPDAILQTTSNEADTPIWLSTLSMRKVGGYEDSQFKVLKLMMKHMDDIAARDEGNGLEGIWVLRTVFQFFPIYETSTGASGAKKALSGYIIVDWRRAANMDPYEVTSKILETSILWKPTLWEILVARLAMIPFPGWVKRIFRHFVC